VFEEERKIHDLLMGAVELALQAKWERRNAEELDPYHIPLTPIPNFQSASDTFGPLARGKSLLAKLRYSHRRMAQPHAWELTQESCFAVTGQVEIRFPECSNASPGHSCR
jgi:hypothetical protein